MALTKIKTGSVSDSITLTTPDINGGTIDATVIGGTTAAAISGTTITATVADANPKLKAAYNATNYMGISHEKINVQGGGVGLIIQGNGTDRATFASGGGLTLAGGVIKGERGTAAAPAYTFSDDPDTGMFNISNVDLGFSVGGTERMRIDSSGRVTMPYQPAFQVRKNAIQTNIAVGSAVTVIWQIEIFDQGANFASNTFTAPVTGKYQLNAHLLLDNIDSDADYYQLILNTSNSLYYDTMDPFIGGADYSYQTVNNSVLADMDAGDTAIVTIVQGGGTSQSDLNATTCVFSGYLVA